MAAILRASRPEMSESMIRVSSPVSSVTWQAAAYLANWLRGKGACLVPWCAPERSVNVSSTNTFRFRVKTRTSAIQRVWLVIMRTTMTRTSAIQRVWLVIMRTTMATDVEVVLRAPGGTGTAQTILTVPSTMNNRTAFVYVENLSSKSGAEQQISISVGVSGSQGSAIVDAISCFEQDRPILNLDSTDYGVDVVSASTAQPIYDGANRSIGGIMDALANCDARRVGIWHWCNGDSELATNSSATYATLLSLAVPALGRKLARAATTGVVKWSVYAKMSAAGTGDVRITTTSSGVSDVMSVTSTSYAWTTAREISIDCDDMTAEDGRQGSSWDDLQIEFRGDGTNSIIVQSISIWSDD